MMSSAWVSREGFCQTQVDIFARTHQGIRGGFDSALLVRRLFAELDGIGCR